MSGPPPSAGRAGLAFIHNRPVDAAEANVGAVLNQARAFAGAGARTWLTLYAGADVHAPAPALVDGLSLRLARPRRGVLSYPALVTGALAGGGGEVVYTRIPQIALYAMLAGRRAVLEMHTPIAALRQGPRLLGALDRLAPRLAGVVTISPALEAELRAELPRMRGPWLSAPSAAPDLAAPPGAPAADHDAGYVGGFTRGKGGEFVLALARAAPDLRFLLGGDLSAAPGLAEQAASLANVTVLGPVGPGALAATLARCRLLLAPYERAVFGSGSSGIDLARWMSPLKLAEYASAGGAIVASRLPAVQAMVADGREAVLCEPGDVAGWTATLRSLLGAAGERARFGAAARALYRRELSWEDRARRILDACGL